MDFTEDPFKDYRYEDPFNIEDPFADAPDSRRSVSVAAFDGFDPFGDVRSGRESAPPAPPSTAPDPFGPPAPAAWAAWPDAAPDNWAAAWPRDDNRNPAPLPATLPATLPANKSPRGGKVRALASSLGLRRRDERHRDLLRAQEDHDLQRALAISRLDQ